MRAPRRSRPPLSANGRSASRRGVSTPRRCSAASSSGNGAPACKRSTSVSPTTASAAQSRGAAIEAAAGARLSFFGAESALSRFASLCSIGRRSTGGGSSAAVSASSLPMRSSSVLTEASGAAGSVFCGGGVAISGVLRQINGLAASAPWRVGARAACASVRAPEVCARRLIGVGRPLGAERRGFQRRDPLSIGVGDVWAMRGTRFERADAPRERIERSKRRRAGFSPRRRGARKIRTAGVVRCVNAQRPAAATRRADQRADRRRHERLPSRGRRLRAGRSAKDDSGLWRSPGSAWASAPSSGPGPPIPLQSSAFAASIAVGGRRALRFGGCPFVSSTIHSLPRHRPPIREAADEGNRLAKPAPERASAVSFAAIAAMRPPWRPRGSRASIARACASRRRRRSSSAVARRSLTSSDAELAGERISRQARG